MRRPRQNSPAVRFFLKKYRGDMFRFRVENSDGRMLTRTYPRRKPAEIDAKSDDELRTLVC